MRLTDLLDESALRRLSAAHPGLALDRVVVRTFPGRLPTGTWLKGITIGRQVWVDADLLDLEGPLLELLAHELTHVQQWRERGPAGFLLRYWLDYLRGRLKGASHMDAYEAIPAEVEARSAARTLRDLRPE